MILRKLSLLCLLFLSIGPLQSEPAPELTDFMIRKGVVLVHITTIHYNDMLPWQSQSGTGYTVAGLVLGNNRIMVLSSDIKNASLIEVWKFSSSRRVIAKTVRDDSEANLAVLELEDASFFSDLMPFNFGRDPYTGRKVTAAMMDHSFRVHREEISITDVVGMSESGFTNLPYMIFRTSEPFTGGGILLCGNELCGFIGFANKNKQTEALLPSVIQSFRDSAGSPFVSQGFSLGQMKDPVLRSYYGMENGETGALVNRVISGTSAYGHLNVGDVLLEIDGRKLSDDGDYEDPRFGLQKGQMLFVRDDNRIRKPGEVVSLSIIRNKKKMKIDVPLRIYEGNAERIPSIVTGPPPFLIESGFVFVEVTYPALRDGFGSSWRSSAIEMAYLYDTERFLDKPGRERFVMLVGVFPDELTAGYEDVRNILLKTLNGEPVKSLEMLRDRLKAKKEGISVLESTSGMKIFLDQAERERVNERIQKRYRLTELSRLN